MGFGRRGGRSPASPVVGGGGGPPSSLFSDDTDDCLGHGGDQVTEGGRGASGVWLRLHRSGASQAAIGIGWRILHAALPVRAKVAYLLGRPLEEGLCEAPGCSCQETLSHAFLECDKVRGAVDWLLDLFETISGQRPPRDPRILLADDHRVWEARGGEGALWQFLRLTMLHHIWRVRSSRQVFQRRGDGDLATAAIAGAAADIQRAIGRDWARTRLGEARRDSFFFFFFRPGHDYPMLGTESGPCQKQDATVCNLNLPVNVKW
jgi:hypothetical protein